MKSSDKGYAKRRGAHARARGPETDDRTGLIARTAAYATTAGRTAGHPTRANDTWANDTWVAAPTPQPEAPPRPASDYPSWPPRPGPAPAPQVRPVNDYSWPGQAGPATPHYDRPAAGQPRPGNDYPSWPARPGPSTLHHDHPSWPGRPDPRWAEPELPLPPASHPSWPEPYSPPRRDAGPPTDYRDPGGPGSARAAVRRDLPPDAPRPPHRPHAPAVPTVLPVRIRTDFAPRADITPSRAPMRQESAGAVIDRLPPEAGWLESQPGWGQPEPGWGQSGWGQSERDWFQTGDVQVWDADSAQLASWIISEANQQAADIRHEADEQVSAALAGAKQEAAELVRKASEQASAALTAAEAEAAEIRATVGRLSAELNVVAARVTGELVGLAAPATKPGARPADKPGTKPAGKPGTMPTGKPKGAPRQLVAARVAAAATAALFLVAVAAGASEVALHGFSFFVFRTVGNGETGPNGLQENQGPGQPDAPKPMPSNVRVHPSPHGTVTARKG
jgi:hypothetical protein